MAKTLLIIGKSGSGKSTSLRNLNEKEYGLINVLGKELPFRNKKKSLNSDNYNEIKQYILTLYKEHGIRNFIIDDAGYLITNQYMKAQGSDKKGNKTFELFSDMATNFFDIIRFAQEVVPNDAKIVFFMHEDKNDFGDVKPKTMGKMLDEKVCIEGLFTIVLNAVKKQDKHVFLTKTDGSGVTKSPMGMFDEDAIDNDLKLVFEKIDEYYNIGE